MNLVDMHCDTITVLMNDNDSLRSNNRHIDLLRMKDSNYLLQNFAIFTHLKDTKDPMYYCLRGISYYYRQIEENNDLIRPIYSYKDIEDNLNNNIMSSMLTLEEGGVVNNDINMLDIYYKLGVRMITLTWNFPNNIGFPNFTPSKDIDRYHMLRQLNTADGLTDFGIAYVKRCEELGIIIDVSHIGDKCFYDVLKYTTKPFVASHSNCRGVCDVARNLSDEMILELHKRNGVMGINYCEDFVDNNGDGNIENIIKHIDHIKELGCIDNVGLGSDFDGINTRKDLADCGHMHDLLDALKRHNYTDEEIDKITHLNVLRVYKEVLK